MTTDPGTRPYYVPVGNEERLFRGPTTPSPPGPSSCG